MIVLSSIYYRPSKVVQLYHPNTEFDKKSDETDGITLLSNKTSCF